MIEHRNVPKKYWAEVVYIVVYLLNRSPTHVIKKMTPEEAWSGRKPKVGHLKVFSSTTHVWIPNAKRAKLDSKSQTLMFTNYNENHKAYKLIDVETDHLIFSRDVVVDETTGPFIPSTTPSLATPSVKTFDVGVCLPLGSHDGRALEHFNSEDEESTDPAPPDFSQESHLDDFVPEL